jgi:probable HAF family extracellular repeat protein
LAYQDNTNDWPDNRHKTRGENLNLNVFTEMKGLIRMRKHHKIVTPRIISLTLATLAVPSLSAQASSGISEIGTNSSTGSNCQLDFKKQPDHDYDLLGSLREASSNALAVSANGRVIVGTSCKAKKFIDHSPVTSQQHAFIQSLDNSSTTSSPALSQATAVSADGKVVVGWEKRNRETGTRAFRWSQENGFIPLSAQAHEDSYATGVSGDGSVVVGAIIDGSIDYKPVKYAFRWKPDGKAIQKLTSINSTGSRETGDGDDLSSSTATGVSADGHVIVGTSSLLRPWSLSEQSPRAFRWTESAGFTHLSPLNNKDPDYQSWATATNADGSVIVGYHRIPLAREANSFSQRIALLPTNWDADGEYWPPPAEEPEAEYPPANTPGVPPRRFGPGNVSYSNLMAFRWTATEGAVSLACPPNSAHLCAGAGAWSMAHGVSGDGQVVVGNTNIDLASLQYGATPIDNVSYAFRWTRESGMQTIESWLKAAGVGVAYDWRPISANGANADGSVVVGQLEDGRAYIARVDASGSGYSGMIDPLDYRRSLISSANPQLLANAQADLVLHGGHNAPLHKLLKSGQQDAWVTGDWGRQDQQEANASFGTSEFGIAHGLTDAVMLKLAVGRSNSLSNTLYNGSTRVNGTYVVPELVAAIAGSDLYASLSGYYSRGDAEINRSYLNAGTPMIARGTPGIQVKALRMRLDWRNALTLGDTAFTPYTSYTRSRSQVDEYSEIGGGFPVRWDRRNEKTSLVHLGVDTRHRLNGKLNVIARLERVHRMEKSSSGASGQILGLSAFELEGIAYKQDWLSTGIGIEGQVGPGTATVLLNATSEGDSPSTWGMASYRLSF